MAIIKQSETGCVSIGARFNHRFQKELPSGSVIRASAQSNRGGASMRQIWGITLLVGTAVGLLLCPQHVFAQACKDETSMVEGSQQAVMELTQTVKK